MKNQNRPSFAISSHQRFLKTMAYEQADHMSWLEEGLRNDVLQQWYPLGLARGASLESMFCCDRRQHIEMVFMLRPVLKRVPRTLSNLADPHQHLDPDDVDRLPANWQVTVGWWRRYQYLLKRWISRGLFLFVGAHDFVDLEGMLYLMVANPVLARNIMDAYAEFSVHFVERILVDVEVSFAYFSSSSARVMECWIVLGIYKTVLAVLQRHGIETIVFITYANTLALWEIWMDVGFN